MRRLTLAICIAACGGGSREPETFVVENQGQICVVSTNPKNGTFYAEDLPVAVQFRLEGTCLSSTCTREREASCAIATTGTTHEITTFASWVDIRTDTTVCTDDCAMLTATCETDALPAGTHTFVFGTRSLSLAIPSQLPEAPCI